MGTEIERKFLVRDPSIVEGARGTRIAQGYLAHAPEATVRVRIRDDEAFLTVKGLTRGVRRSEFEYAVPEDDAREMLELCPAGRIEKTRYEIPVGDHVWEVDVFHGDNDGLVLAEVELADENEAPEMPSWLGREVSGDPRYFNSNLSLTPWSPEWEDQHSG